MRRPLKLSLAVALAAFLALGLFASPKKEYFTEDEIDTIRDAHELSARVPAYIRLAERRLVFLGIMEKSAQEIEKERKERAKREKDQKDSKKTVDARANADKAPLDDTSYLDTFTPAELLRGYIQALDEITDNIDDAYRNRLDVRDSLEDLNKFVRDTVPLLEKFKAKNDSERSAVQDSIDRAKEVASSTKEALSIVPKTEKKRK